MTKKGSHTKTPERVHLSPTAKCSLAFSSFPSGRAGSSDARLSAYTDGQFFVEEAIRLKATTVGAPYALALSARSDVLQEFDGGPGQIALHGLMNVGGTLGSAVSHGCIRLGNDMMRWLVMRIGAGTPVTITN